jgi:hypothetical protein
MTYSEAIRMFQISEKHDPSCFREDALSSASLMHATLDLTADNEGESYALNSDVSINGILLQQRAACTNAMFATRLTRLGRL